MRLFVYGFPSHYGGAGSELDHQIVVWQEMGIDVHIIPSESRLADPMYSEMVERQVTVHQPNDWDMISPGDPVLGFCNAEFLNNLDHIHARTRRTVFVNCMTWLFEKEKQRMAEGKFGMFLYQNAEVMGENMPKLRKLNDSPDIRFCTFRPYFDTSLFPYYNYRESEHFGCGRISRQDADKYAANTLHIYEYFVSPRFKKGLFLGFDQKAKDKIGEPYDWIRTARDQTEVSQQEFYQHCEIVLQPSDTTENWPRIGFEAMASGSVLIVDNRGGWRQMIDHGKTGWLCNHERDFIYYASKMAYEPNLRREIAQQARERGAKLGGLEASITSWELVFDEVAKMPE